MLWTIRGNFLGNDPSKPGDDLWITPVLVWTIGHDGTVPPTPGRRTGPMTRTRPPWS